MALQPVKTPFSKMSFTPDVPSSALGPNEYNNGRNVETDTRGILSVAGDTNILSGVPGTVIYVTAGFWKDGLYWFVVCTLAGKWYALTSTSITEVTPDSVASPNYISNQYNSTTIFTDSWNGDILFINDSINPPMYLLPTTSPTKFRLYDQSYADQTPNTYVWNYYTGTDPTSWDGLQAGFMRLYNSPNVGSLLIAGNLTAQQHNGITVNFPTTVRWSQNFGLNSGPTTWAPTLNNVANELEVPVRGPVIDGFPLGGNFYVCSYWDTVVFSPIAYQTSTAPLFGIKIVNQGRGLLNENCWANGDNVVFGLDARDFWLFDGGNFQGIGNQRVKDYFFNNLNSAYYDQVFVVNNTSKYQFETYYPDLASTGFCNKMIAYRYDLDVWQAPKDISNSVHAVESPRWTANVANIATRTVVYAQGGVGNVRLVQTDTGTSFLGNATIPAQFRRDNISFGQPYSNKIQVHRVLPAIVNTAGSGNIVVSVGGANSVGQAPTFKANVDMVIDTNYPWAQINQNDRRITSVIFSSNSNVHSWHLTQADWQISIIEDDR
jgi:hypothetical protein